MSSAWSRRTTVFCLVFKDASCGPSNTAVLGNLSRAMQGQTFRDLLDASARGVVWGGLVDVSVARIVRYMPSLLETSA